MKAVILTERAGGPGDELPGLYDTGGLSMLSRMARSAQVAGADEILLVGPSAGDYRAELAGDAELAIDWSVVETAGEDPGVGPRLARIADRLTDSFWLIALNRAVTPGVFSRLEDPPAGDGEAVGLVDERDRWVAMRVDPDLLATIDGDGAGCASDLDQFAERLHDDGRLERRSAEVCWHPVDSEADGAEARSRLLASLRKPLAREGDGVTAYLINRPISLALTRFLIYTPATPNVATAIGLLAGLAGAAMAATGEYTWMVAGALSLQASSIIDGIDGEIARMKLVMSDSGEWFDTICDDLINIGFMTGLGVGCYLRAGDSLLLGATGVGAFAGVGSAGLLYYDLIRKDIASHNDFEWGFEDDDSGLPAPIQWFLIAFSFAAKRDTYNLLLVVLLVANLPAIAFWLMVLGTVGIFIGLIVQKTIG